MTSAQDKWLENLAASARQARRTPEAHILWILDNHYAEEKA